MKILSLMVGIFLMTPGFSQDRKTSLSIEAGNGFYRQQQYAQAEKEYRKALESDPAEERAGFNLANTNYRQDQKVEAVQRYTALARDAKTRSVRAGSYYNKGVVLSGQKNIEESIEAYKNALRLNPADQDARDNLQKALLELRKKKTPQPEPKKDRKKKEEQQQQQKPQSSISQKETEQRLKLLRQKEKEVQQRLQQEKKASGGSMPKDW